MAEIIKVPKKRRISPKSLENLTGGSRKGAKNVVTANIKAMIEGALQDAGGQAYLLERANDPKTSAAFMGLVGKVLPKEVKAEVAMTHIVSTLTQEQKRAIAEAILIGKDGK